MINLFNNDFKFLRMEAGTDYARFMACKDQAESVEIPHDWTIHDVNLFYADATGCYIKTFDYSKKDNFRTFIRFDGIYMDSEIYLNGTKIGEWKYGYTSFVYELTDNLVNGQNELVVLACFRNPNSRWYSGAGIYRNVWLIETAKVYIPDGGIYVHSEKKSNSDDWTMTLEVTLSDKWEATNAVCNYYMPHLVAKQTGEIISEDGYTKIIEFDVSNPKLWSCENPNIYSINVSLCVDDIIQSQDINIGFRTIEFTTDHGLLVNGDHVKINGVCEHHDFGALGAAFYPEALQRKIDILKEMGVNSIRTSHNPAPPEFYDLCDQNGILVLAEAFDMWEHAKTEFDYARFFEDWHERDVERWILDGRNHPCVIMWSIGNEISDTHAGPRGREVANMLADLVKKHDPCGNARVTLCSNYMPWENTQKVADDLKLAGYNYAESYYEPHHKEHPDWIIYGSETSSIVYSRGVYHFPYNTGILAEDDLQCSALGNSTTSWSAKSLEACIGIDAGLEFSLGQYIWTGFDYIGEPTPYHTKNSYFGSIDTAGFPKDPYFAWKAAWTDVKTKPMVHVFPYWSFNVGQLIDVRICTNGAEVELLVNGKSCGKKKPEVTLATYSVEYEEGEITAIAYDTEGNEIARETRYSFGDTKGFDIKRSDYGKLSFFEITAIDENGNPVENACDYIKVKASDGRLLGLDNGDSTDNDSYKSDTRKLFKGKILAIVQNDENRSSEIEVISVTDYIGARDIKLVCSEAAKPGRIAMGADCQTIEVNALLCPADSSTTDIDVRLTDSHGNDSIIAKYTKEAIPGGIKIIITAMGDGDFIIRASTNNDVDHAEVISQLEFSVNGMGQMFMNPYTFIPGSTFTRSIGEVTSGNERGAATQREMPTVVIFDGVDFGRFGANEMEIPVFALTDEAYVLQIFDGVPGEEGAKLICDGIYQKKSIWNTYQSETYKLDEVLKGIHTISLRTTNKIHIKGFSCTEVDPLLYPMWAADAEKVYGDQYEKNGQCVEKIGNNVTIDYGTFDFGDKIDKITIFGRARNGVNTLHIRLFRDDADTKEVVEFEPTTDYVEREFEINGLNGKGSLSVIFMPGSDFDLGWIKFGTK